ncbi:type II secretory pathway protein [Paraburkholderia atlantica]|uniref:type II secretory pathway protein n=1 Tax=Paraburkholderia atlantica TaxID=2654982 RepID=UPI00161A6277|nr:type II secretory pathway protein [Paraburkholderia atlantica]MBB5420623.1 type IVB pilus formation R64 PilN family outer membrane protein [Paraburkholderia atlantica]
MRHASIIKTGLAVACSLMIAGCAVNQGDINAAYDGAHRTGSDAMANLPGSMALVEDVPTAFLGDRLVPVAYEATLPATFREKKVTMPANIGIRQISTLISGATGYPVRLSPDVFVPRSSLVPRESAGGNVTTRGSNGNAYEEPVYGQVFTGHAGAYLTRMTEDLGLDWSFDGSTINITRFVTRMYQIAAIPGKVSIKSTMSKGMDTSTGNQANGTGGSGGNTGSFAAQTSTGREGDFDQIKSISDALDKLRTPMGHVNVNPQSRLVMIYDTREAADRMGKLLAQENAVSTRQVMLRVRTLQIALNNGSQAGVNADVVFNYIQGGLAKYAVSFTSPTSLSSGGGTVGLSVLQANAPFSGTNAVINALNQYGRTVQDSTQTKMTLNGLPVSIASFQSDDYLRSTSPSAGSLTATSGGVPGLTPGTVTTGDFVNILPAVNDHNQIILSYWADSSKLNGPFTSASVGSGQTLQQIQLAHTTGSKEDQTIALSDGQTVVLYGQMTDLANSTTNGGIAGITGLWNKSKTFQVIMLTATVVPSM